MRCAGPEGPWGWVCGTLGGISGGDVLDREPGSEGVPRRLHLTALLPAVTGFPTDRRRGCYIDLLVTS